MLPGVIDHEVISSLTQARTVAWRLLCLLKQVLVVLIFGVWTLSLYAMMELGGTQVGALLWVCVNGTLLIVWKGDLR